MFNALKSGVDWLSEPAFDFFFLFLVPKAALKL